MLTTAEMLAQGWQFQKSSDKSRAEQISRQILQTEPANVDALHLLAVSLHASGRLAEAVEQYQKVLRVSPTCAEVYNDLGTALAMQDRLDEAIPAFQRVVELKPGFPDGHSNLGNALRLRGRSQEAIAQFHEAIRLKPTYGRAHQNLGLTLLEQGRPDQAIASLQQAVRFMSNGSGAPSSPQQALSCHPDLPDIYNNLGNALFSAGRHDEAVAAYREALRLKPTLAETHSNLGNVLCKQGLLDEGIGCYRQALLLRPNYADVYNNLGCALKEQGQIAEAIDCLQRARQIQPEQLVYHNTLLGSLIYHPQYHEPAIREEHKRWDLEHALSLRKSDQTFPNNPVPGRRLRIGYISPDFRDHVVGRNVWPLIRNHDHTQFEIFLYSNMNRAGAMREQFQKSADHWCDIAGWPDGQVAERIRQDGIDVLVDLALHTRGNRVLVLARKPAPVQVTFAGYPGSTGLSAVDYRLTDPYLDPPGQNDAALYAEHSYRLPHSFWCYDPQSEEPAVGPLPALANGYVTFGCLNNFCKVNDGVLELWARVLRAVAGSRLLLVSKPGSHRQRTIDFLSQRGIEPGRVEFCSPMPRPQYVATYNQVDIGLDTFPYNGHTTSLDSFWMGVPVITLIGNTVVGRAGLSQLSNLGLKELAAPTPDDFVRLAADLASDLPRLESLRSGLRERMRQSPLMDAAGFARGIEQAYQIMWHKWCAQQPQGADDMPRFEQITQQGTSLARQGRLDEAIALFKEAVQLQPSYAKAHYNLGTALANQSRVDEAIACFRRALELNPDYALAHLSFGNALRIQGRLDEAITHLQEAIRLSPNWADAHHNLVIALQQRHPNSAESHKTLGDSLYMAGRHDEAIASYREALRLEPTLAEVHSNLGTVLYGKGLLDEGIACYRKALQLQPDFADAHNNLGIALREQGQLDESVDCLQRARRFKPEEQSYHTALLGTLNYHSRQDARAIREEHKRWEKEHALSLRKRDQSFPNDTMPERRLRIGYVSPDFSSHVVGRNILPLMRNHDHSQFEIFLYANMTSGDPMTQQFQKCADHWCPIAGIQDDLVSERIRQDGIDILVDLALHTIGNRLLIFARKPAPVQVTFAGYPGSTGLSAIDYRLTDPYLDPPGQADDDGLYAEASYALPNSFWCYDPQSEEPAVAPLPAMEKGYVTFGCLNNYCKINDGVLELWSRVLRAIPGSRLLLRSNPGSHRQRTLDFLALQGIAAERVQIFSKLPRPEYLALYHQVDIGLDTLPYNGHTTSLDSFWMGVPVITLVGKTAVGRAGLSQLTNLGLEELAASTPEDFVRLAVDLAGDLPRLKSLRSGLRERMRQSPLMDATGFTRGIEQAYRLMWRKWCAQEHQLAEIKPRLEQITAQATTLARQGRLDEAMALFREVVELQPTNAKAHYNLATALANQGRHDEAIACFRRSLELNSDFAPAHLSLGNALRIQGRHEEAINHLQDAIRLDPNSPQAHFNLGIVHRDRGREDLAIAAFQQAAEVHYARGNAHADAWRLDDAMVSYQHALELNPTFAKAYNSLGHVRKDKGQLDEAIACYEKALSLQPAKHHYHSNLLGTLLYHPRYDNRALFEEQRRWEANHTRSFADGLPSFGNNRDPGRRLRIGYVSPDFRDHVVGNNVWPLLRNHDHSQFEVTLYATVAGADSMTELFRKCADHWCDIAGWPDEQVVEKIKQDGIDILVDLALHTPGNRLLVFARKPAPVQVSFAGYPGSTGLRVIDYRLTDPYLDPPGLNDQWYAEESYRLPHSYWCFDPRSEEPAVGPLPALKNGFVTFGCLNNFCKINDGVLELWARVLRAVPQSRLLLLSKPGSHRQRTVDFMAQQGIAPDRIEFFTPSPRPEYVALYHRLDIGLDTLPYSGHTTSLDSYWMGVPVITLIGKTVFGRAGLSQLTNLGLEELAASTPEEFVRLAVDLASDLPRLESLRSSLRQRLRQSPLMDATQFARGIEQAYRFMWRKWCAAQAPSAQDQPRFDELTRQGTSLARQGRLDEAIVSFHQAVQLQPTDARSHYNLGTALAHHGRYDEAIGCFQRTLELDSAYALAHLNLGNALRIQGMLDEAITHLQEAIRLKSNWAEAHHNLGCTLKEQGQVVEAIESLQQARQLKPEDHSFQSALLSTLSYHPHYDDRAIHEEHRRWELERAVSLANRAQAFPNEPLPRRRLRVGYVSPDFRDHVVGRNVWPLLHNHDRSQVEIFLFANLTGGDSMTEQFRKCADHWCAIAGMTDDQVAEIIRQDGIDILVDLALHTNANRLLVFARKPAPVQVTFAGYPGSTGLGAIDYRLTDPYLDPPGQPDAGLYAEESYRLPHSFWCFEPQTEEPAVAPLPALEKGFIAFGNLNSFCKINDGVLELWARVLRAVPGSRLLLRCKPGSHRQRTLDFLARQGIAGERIEFCTYKPRPEYLALYHQIDIGLDTLPYNGHSTSIDSFWMGVPVITLIGKTVVGRAGWSQLTNLGLEELAASTPDDFVRLAVDLAGDLPRLQSLRNGLRERLKHSPLMDATAFTRGIEQAYRFMWGKWCAKQAQLAEDGARLDQITCDATALARQGRLDEAITLFSKVAQQQPTEPRAHYNLGTALAKHDRLDEAIACFQRTLELDPAYALAHFNVGNALRIQKKLTDAITHLRESVRIKPNLAEAHHTLGSALLDAGQHDQAIAALQEAVKCKPDYADAHNLLGTAFFGAGRLDEALASFQNALRIKPDYAEAYSNMGSVHSKQGRVDEAMASYRQALRYLPDFALANINLAACLIEQCQFDQALDCLQRARKTKPEDQSYQSNYLGTLHYVPEFNRQAILDQHRIWEREHALPLLPATPRFTNDPAPERRLRIGYVSPDFRQHVVAHNVLPLMQNHDHDRFSIALYAHVASPDSITEEFQRRADNWCNIASMSDEKVAERIRQDGIDILVDLALHTVGNRLLVFARKPAPIQVTFAGYPGTTGLSAIDYRLTDPHLDPPGQGDAWYAEQSYRLPHSFWCYDPLTEEPAVAPLPALANGRVTFGCYHSSCKVNQAVLETWAQVLRGVQGSRLLLVAKPGSQRQRTIDFLTQHGVAAERIEFFPRKPRPEYLTLYSHLDIVLDTFPYNGHTSSLDCFWMGVPVITLVGNTVVGRAGLSQLTNLGLQELAASTPEEFVRLAVELASDVHRLESLRSGLRERMRQSPLMDSVGFTRGIEQAYRAMWRKWCDKRSRDLHQME